MANWLHSLWFGYGWPSIKGNGPEAAVELALLAALGRLVWPRLKRSRDELHRKLDHIIKHHPDIPDLPPKEDT